MGQYWEWHTIFVSVLWERLVFWIYLVVIGADDFFYRYYCSFYYKFEILRVRMTEFLMLSDNVPNTYKEQNGIK